MMSSVDIGRRICLKYEHRGLASLVRITGVSYATLCRREMTRGKRQEGQVIVPHADFDESFEEEKKNGD